MIHDSSRRGQRQLEMELGLQPWNDLASQMWSPVLSGLQAWNLSCARAFTRMSGEWASFVSRRLAKDMALPQKLAAAGAAGRAWQTYASFLQDMATDYQLEFCTLAGIGCGAPLEAPRTARTTATTVHAGEQSVRH